MDFKIPANFPPLAQDIENNYPTQKGFELGRKLFYDGRLSADGTVSVHFVMSRALPLHIMDIS